LRKKVNMNSVQVADAKRIEAELRGLSGLPVPVRRWEVETGYDHDGDPLVTVYAVLDDADFAGLNAFAIREAVGEVVARVAGSPFPISVV
jgi:hypothetical protein